MKLNIDCIRDILICVEENSNYSHGVKFYNPFSKYVGIPRIPDYNEQLLDKYGKDSLIYHIEYCFKDNLLEEDIDTKGPYIGVLALSPRGHSLIDTIRDESIFEKAKSIANILSTNSIPSIIEIANIVSRKIIADYFKKSFIE